jgi:hypothetical protein
MARSNLTVLRRAHVCASAWPPGRLLVCPSPCVMKGGCEEELLELFQGDQSKVDAVLNSVQKIDEDAYRT